MHIIYPILVLFALCSCNLVQHGGQLNANKKSKAIELTEKEEVQFKKLFFNANKEKNLGNHEAAIELFSECVRKNPTSSAPMYELAMLYSDLGKRSEAIFFALKACELDPQNYWYHISCAEISERHRQYDLAIKSYKNAINIKPNDVHLQFRLASAQIKNGKSQDAIGTYNKLESKLGIAEEISLEKEMIYIRLNKIEKAATELKKLINKYPNEVRYQGMLAELYQANNKNDLALAILLEITKNFPNDPNVHLSLASYYQSIGDFEESYNELRIAFSNSNLDIDKKIGVLMSFYTLSDAFPELRGKAIVLCKTLVNTHPKEAKAHSMYGDFLYRKNNLDSARTHYQIALELDPNHFFIWRQLLQIESELMDYESMLKESNTAIELFPSQSILYLFNGIAYLQKKNFPEAIESLKKGIALEVENELLLSSLYSSLGDSYHSKKDTFKSDSSYENALKYNPDNIYVLNNYSYYLSLRGDSLEKATKMSKKAVSIDPDNLSFQDTYAWILYKVGKLEDAKIWIEKAILNGGDERPVILEHYGDILFKLGDTEKALTKWDEAKSMGKGSDLLEKKINEKQLYE